MRLKRYAPSTIESYTNWILRFILYHNKRHPREMGAAEIGAFLSHLAKEKHVSGSTQNQALQAILYLYKRVLRIEVGNLDFARAIKDKRLPTILSRSEVQGILTAMSETDLRLMAQLCYGSGLRLTECLRLRVKDVDLASQRITVRDTKSNRDRHTILPKTLVAPLEQHIERIVPLHQSDIANGIGVYLPDAIASKYKNASRETGWRYLFPSKSITKGERGEPLRHHIHVTSLQKEFHRAVQHTKLRKPASIHMLRHAVPVRNL
jgi:integron integrase